MNNVLKVSEAASVALHSMVLLASDPGRTLSAKEMGYQLQASVAHLSKVLQRLVKVGLVTSTRGPGGGFRLAKAAGEVSLLDVYEAIEGPLAPSGCLFDRPVCSCDRCIMGSLLESVGTQVRDYLRQTTLDGFRERGVQKEVPA